MSLDYPDRKVWLARRASLNWARFQKSRHRILHVSAPIQYLRQAITGVVTPVVGRGTTYRRTAA